LSYKKLPDTGGVSDMDIKELFAKITGKNKDSAGSKPKKQNAVSAFFEKNPMMKYVVAIIAIAVAVFVALTVVWSSRNSKPELDTNITANANSEVEVLPQIERDKGGEYEGKDPFVENILDGAKLTGIYETYGYKSATLETTRKSYTLYEGDTVGDSDWVVSEITDKSITLVSGDKTKTFSK
jgi:large-conductance mechanosensitive channel